MACPLARAAQHAQAPKPRSRRADPSFTTPRTLQRPPPTPPAASGAAMAVAALADTATPRCGPPRSAQQPTVQHPRRRFALQQQQQRQQRAGLRRAAGAAAAAGRRAAALSVRAAQKQVFTSFDDLLQKSELPVLVDMYASWCGPCHLQSRVLETLAPDLKDRVKFVKVRECKGSVGGG